MGGTVAETIRQENGEIIKMARKTGAYNWMFFSKKFNNDQINEAIDDHVELFNQMKEDFETGEPYKYPMSPVYGWCNHTAPIDYGLVVIDFKEKKIHSMQEYDSPATLHSIYFSTTMKHSEEVTEDYKFIVNHNCVDVYDEDMNYCGDVHSVFGSVNTYDNIQQSFNNNYIKIIQNIINPSNVPKKYIFMPKILKDFQFINYNDNPDGIIHYLTALAADGFNFNTEETSYWKECINIKEYVCENLSNEDYDAITDIDQYSENAKKEFEEKIDMITSNNVNNNHKIKL